MPSPTLATPGCFFYVGDTHLELIPLPQAKVIKQGGPHKVVEMVSRHLVLACALVRSMPHSTKGSMPRGEGRGFLELCCLTA